MKISFIIPNYNNSFTISKTIQSIIDSKIKNSEILVIDDASSDNSVKVIKKIKQVKLYEFKTNSGAAKARNKGIELAKGNILIFIDSDAWFEKNAIKELLNSISDADMRYPKTIFENNHIFHPLGEFEEKYPQISVCFAIKKKSLGNLRFDENFETYLEDMDFFMRCSLANLTVKYCKNSIVTHVTKSNIDWSNRYYLEVRNITYGIRKWFNKKKTIKVYNPFTLLSLTKVLFYGIINFAWFNWSGYDRQKKKLIKGHKNRICKFPIKLPFLFVKGVINGLKKFYSH